MVQWVNGLRWRGGDLLLAAGVVLLALCLLAGLVWGSHRGQTVQVTVDGAIFATLPLDTDATLPIAGFDGGQNILVIADGQVWIDSASCPDKICVRHRAISRVGQSIVCLPNRVVVAIIGPELPSVDGEA